ncbi:MAG: hypothetical protein R2744_13945 [Bacteroidales bacterium]
MCNPLEHKFDIEHLAQCWLRTGTITNNAVALVSKKRTMFKEWRNDI